MSGPVPDEIPVVSYRMSAAPASMFPPAMFFRPRYVGLRATIAPTILKVRLTPVRTNPRALTNMPPRRPPRFFRAMSRLPGFLLVLAHASQEGAPLTVLTAAERALLESCHGPS